MNDPAVAPFRVAFTGDFHDAAGTPRYREFGQATLKPHPHIVSSVMPPGGNELTPTEIGDAHGVVVLASRVTRQSLAGCPDLLAIARFGVGYDSVDVPACTAADVLLTIAVGAVDRSVAEATLTWMLALSHYVRSKDLLVRNGGWDQRSQFMGTELRRKTLGLVGFGRIAQAVVQLAGGFGMQRFLAFDPLVDRDVAARLGVDLIGLDDLLARSDFVSIHCPLNDSTRNLIGANELARMKPEAYLINTARGGIVNEQALCCALHDRRIAGAGIDVFEHEPVTGPHPLAELDNVLLAPHCIAWTHELFSEIGETACQGLVDLSLGRTPRGIVNPEVLSRPGFQQKWSRWK
ncbi:MAG: phosphoglycerate dehydrogenase [Planctomycetia bacterium]|nr:phosphoglycerate dehydrogenase [Planctomycetia bacterium]